MNEPQGHYEKNNKYLHQLGKFTFTIEEVHWHPPETGRLTNTSRERCCIKHLVLVSVIQKLDTYQRQ